MNIQLLILRLRLGAAGGALEGLGGELLGRWVARRLVGVAGSGERAGGLAGLAGQGERVSGPGERAGGPRRRAASCRFAPGVSRGCDHPNASWPAAGGGQSSL